MTATANGFFQAHGYPGWKTHFMTYWSEFTLSWLLWSALILANPFPLASKRSSSPFGIEQVRHLLKYSTKWLLKNTTTAENVEMNFQGCPTLPLDSMRDSENENGTEQSRANFSSFINFQIKRNNSFKNNRSYLISALPLLCYQKRNKENGIIRVK